MPDQQPEIKRLNTRLDKGFPASKIFIGILFLVFFLQGISAWKIMNLEKEKVFIDAQRQQLEKDQKDYEWLTTKLSEMKVENEKYELELPPLRAEYSSRKRELSQVAEEKEKISSEINT